MLLSFQRSRMRSITANLSIIRKLGNSEAGFGGVDVVTGWINGVFQLRPKREERDRPKIVPKRHYVVSSI